MFTLVLFVFLELFAVGFAQTKCITPNGEEAKCIPIKQCDVFKNAILNNPSADVKRFLRESHCGSINNQPLVCCGTVTIFKTIETKDIIFPPLNFTPIDESTHASVKSNLTNHKNIHLLPPRTVCGEFILDNYLPRASSGTPEIGEYVWLALLEYRKNGSSTGYNCGGILISNRYILTAAHCVTGRIIKHAGNLFRVRLGEHNIKTNPDCDSFDFCAFHQDIDVEEVIPHPSYNSTGEELNDIALVRLAKPAVFNDVVNPICLPLNGEMFIPEKGGNAVVGWSQSTNESLLGAINDLKHFAGVSFISLEECKKKYAPRNYKLTEQHYCLLDNTEVRCVPDSGGPILNLRYPFNSGQRWNVDGILSVKICYANEKKPSIYINTRVEHYVTWILDNLKP